MFADLQSFKNDPGFWRSGYAQPPGRDWLDALEAERECPDGLGALLELGYVAGDLFTLGTDYYDNNGNPRDEFTATVESALSDALARAQAAGLWP